MTALVRYAWTAPLVRVRQPEAPERGRGRMHMRVYCVDPVTGAREEHSTWEVVGAAADEPFAERWPDCLCLRCLEVLAAGGWYGPAGVAVMQP